MIAKSLLVDLTPSLAIEMSLKRWTSKIARHVEMDMAEAEMSPLGSRTRSQMNRLHHQKIARAMATNLTLATEAGEKRSRIKTEITTVAAIEATATGETSE
jgi:hypothetical protein